MMAEYLDLPSNDIGIVKCFSKGNCLNSSEFAADIESSGFSVTNFDVNPKETTYSLDLLSTVNSAKIVLVFYCQHVRSTLEKVIKQQLITYKLKVILITESHTFTRNVGDFKCFTVDEKDNLIKYVEQKLDDSDFERYPPLHQVDGKPQSPPTRCSRIRSSVSQETNLKVTHSSKELAKPKKDSSGHYNSFIHVETFDCIDDNRGIHVLRTSCLPRVSISVSVNEIKRRFNASTQENREDLSKQILVMLKGIMKSCDFLGMLNFLDIDDCNIQSSVFSAIDSFQLETGLYGRCIRGTELMRAAKYLFGLLRKWSANQAVTIQLLSVTLDTVGVLYLASYISGTSQTDLVPEIQLFAQNSIPVIDKIITDSASAFKNSQEYSDLLISLRKMLESLKVVGDNPSPLLMGNFRDTLMSESNQIQLKTKFAKTMTYLEQYAFILVVVNQIVMKSDLQIVTFLKELTEKQTERVVKKERNIQTVYPLLKLVTKGVVHRLCKGSSLPRTTPEYQLKLCDVLNVFVGSTKIPQVKRLHLLKLMEPLLFRENKELVKNMVLLYQANNHQSKDIRGKVSEHIVKQLSPINFKLDGILQQSSKVGLEPSWVTFAGTISDNKHVIMYTLIPTLHCMAEGSMSDYKRRAEKSETKKHLNTLDILKHLQDDTIHHNLIQLIAFQCRPLPVFYITDQSFDHDLNSYLLDARKTFRWISIRDLTTMVADAVDAVAYLHSKRVVHRNLTTYSFSLRCKNIVLHDFTAAKIIDNDAGFISDLDSTDIPIRWSAPESILEDFYDMRTDIWMLGLFIYEVFTHGCHPYTELYGNATEQILEFIVFQDLKPYKWPCIPKAVHEIICACVMTKPEERLDITRIRKLLSNLIVAFQGVKHKRVTQIFDEDKKYPELDIRQGLPERGLPESFKQLKTNNTQDSNVIRKSYFNLRKSQRSPVSSLQITKADISAPDQPIVQEKHNSWAIYEPVTIDFVQSLPHLRKEICIDVLCMLDSPSREERRHIPGNIKYLLKYRLHKSTKLYDVAYRCLCGDPEEDEDKYLQIVMKIVQFVDKMHQENWILRDLCADHMYLTDNRKQVTAARLGRMLWYDCTAVLDDCIIDEIKEDRRRWQPIEVLQNGQYSKESDVYMLAMVIYEFYMALDIHQTDPMANQLECAPFSKVANDELLKTLYSGEVPLQPDYCPDWLYDIMKLCWNRDRTRRPTTKWIIQEMTKRMSERSNSHESDQEIYHTLDDENVENYEDLEGDEDEDYDDLIGIAEVVNPIPLTGCPVVGIPKYGKVDLLHAHRKMDVRCNPLSEDNTDVKVPFRCVNSDTEFEGSINQNSSRKLNFQTESTCDSCNSSGSAYFCTEFKCVNSSTSESENEYSNVYQHTDAHSGFNMNSTLARNSLSTSKQTLNSEEEDYNMSSASSAYFEVETKQYLPQDRHSEKGMQEMSDCENICKQKTDKRSHCRPKHKLRLQKFTQKPKDVSINAQQTISMSDDDTSSYESPTSSSYIITDTNSNASQSSSSYFSVEMPLVDSSSSNIDKNLQSNCVDISGNPSCCDTSYIRSDRMDTNENIEENEQYRDFESNSDSNIFHPPSENSDTIEGEDEGNDSYLTVYHV